MQRDDFPRDVRERLGKAAGYRCSMPSCRAPTVAGSQTRASGVSQVGVAAHISAASPGGPRYDPDQSTADRSSAGNGIWLCGVDAKRIDDEENRYSRELLVAWREAAERRASDELGRPDLIDSPIGRRLVSHCRTLSDAEILREDVQDFLLDIGALRSWGAAYELGRMVLYELALNAFEHGGVDSVEIRSEDGSVTLRDSGEAFGLDEIREGGRGGHLAVMDVNSGSAGIFSLRHQRQNGRNEWFLVDQILSGGADTPCAFTVSHRRAEMLESAARELQRLEDCDELHFYPPALWSYSDWGKLVLLVLRKRIEKKRLIVHGVPADGRIATLLTSSLPDVQFPD